MSNTNIIINTSKKKSSSARAAGPGIDKNNKTCVHTVKGEDLRIMRPIPGQGGLSMVMKLKG